MLVPGLIPWYLPALPSRLRDRRHDLLMGWVPAAGGLGVHESTVGDDLEPAAAGRDHLDVDAVESLPERGRQTDGFGLVVSGGAVFDGYAHRGASLLFGELSGREGQ